MARTKSKSKKTTDSSTRDAAISKRKPDTEMGPPAKRQDVKSKSALPIANEVTDILARQQKERPVDKDQKEKADALLEMLSGNKVVGLEEVGDVSMDEDESVEIIVDKAQRHGKEKKVAGPAPVPSPSWIFTPLHDELERAYAVTTISIISSAKIEKKATRALEILGEWKEGERGEGKGKDKLVVLHAKARVAGKMISVVEIVKRDIGGKGGKWFQYNAVGSLEEVVPEKFAAGPGAKSKKGEEKSKSGTNSTGETEEVEEEEEVSFETMKTPFERAIEGMPKVRAVPTMTVYLSRVRIESLRKEYGEQTNGLEKKP